MVALFFFGFGIYLAQSQSAYAENQIRATTRAVAQNIVAAVVDDILTERWDNVEVLLLRLADIGSVTELTVADRDGRVISRVVRGRGGAAQADYTPGLYIPVPGSPVELVDSAAFSYVLPIHPDNRLGVVRVSSSLESLAQIRHGIYVDTLLAVWMVLAAAIFVLGFALRSTVRGLEQTAGFAAELPSVRGAQLAVESNVLEVRQLGESLNRMSADLASQHGALQRTVQELEYEKLALDKHAIVSITDASGAITYANDKFEEISGYSALELLGANHRVLKSGLHDDAFYRGLWDSISSGTVWHGEIANRAKNGAIYWVQATIVPWLDANGLPYQYVAIRTDITAAKANEQALELARERELETGHEIQRSLLIGEAPEDLRGACFATLSEPSQGIDGDFFVFHRYSGECFELLAGDVMGKGVPAALIGAAVRNTYSQVLAELLASSLGTVQLPQPGDVVNALHRKLTPRLIALNSFVTLALYRFDLAAGRLTLVNAGHTPGLLARDGAAVASLLGDNLPIGVTESEVYTQREVQLLPGDVLLAYSDGITEARNAQMQEYGEERVRALLQSAHAGRLPPRMVLQALRQRLRDFTGEKLPTDDRTAVMVGLDTGGASAQGVCAGKGTVSEFELDWNLDALAELRTRVAAAAAGGPDAARDALVLAAYEAASNIVRHATQPFADSSIYCRIEREAAAVTVELFYPGAPYTPPSSIESSFSDGSEGGFGLYIIERSVDAVHYACPVEGICSVRLVKSMSDDGTGEHA